MQEPSNINRILAENCENCQVTISQNADGSRVTRFNYEFCLQPNAQGFEGETPRFSTGHTGSKLDWLLKFGPDFRLNLHLLRWDGCEDVKVHVVSCWKLPFVEENCAAINENLDPSLPLPSFWSVKLRTVADLSPGSCYTSQRTTYDSKLLLNISMEDRVSRHAEHLSKYLASALEDGRFSDLILMAGGRKFPVHRAILVQRCPRFWGDRGDDSDHIVLDDIDPEVLEMILKFLYTGRLKNVEETRLDALLATALKWHLRDLKNYCENLIKKRNVRESCQDITVSRNRNNIVSLSVEIL